MFDQIAALIIYNYIMEKNNNRSQLANQQYTVIQASHLLKNNQNLDYFRQYQKINEISFVLHEKVKKMNREEQEIKRKINQLADKANNFQNHIASDYPAIKKKTRRTANQIQSNYICSVQNCQKTYSCETTLRNHIRRMHPEEYNPKKKGRKTFFSYTLQ